MPSATKYVGVAVVAVLAGWIAARSAGSTSGKRSEFTVISQPGEQDSIEELTVDGMTCEGCVSSVMSALKHIDGVRAVLVSLPRKRAIVAGNLSKTTENQLIAAVAEAGYRATATKDTDTAAAKQKPAEANDYTRSVTRPYSEVLSAVEKAAKAEGFRVSNIHDIAASLAKEGIKREPYATVEVCNSRLASQVLNAEPRLGSLMPCRMAVYRQGDKTFVSMVLPSRLMILLPARPEVQETAEKVDQAMKSIVDTATR